MIQHDTQYYTYDSKRLNYWEIKNKNWIIEMFYWAFTMSDDTHNTLQTPAIFSERIEMSYKYIEL